MVGWTLLFVAVALILGVFAYVSGRSTALTMGMAKVLFFVFTALAVASILSAGTFRF